MDTHELSWLGEDFNPGALDHETKAQAVKYLLDACPVAHGTDVRGDYYVVTKHRDVLRVMQEWNTFEVGQDVRIGVEPFPLAMPPLDTNPPLQRQVRNIINPWLSPGRYRRCDGGTFAARAARGFGAAPGRG